MGLRSKLEIYVDIESIIDLRQGYLLYKGMDFEEVETLLRSQEHNERLTDKFSMVSGSTYREEVRNGNIELLKNGTVSYIIPKLVVNIGELIGVDRVDGTSGVPTLVINIHPFNLDNNSVNLLKDAIFTRLGLEIFIEVISVSMESLTPSMFAESNFRIAYIYDFLTWFELHQTAVLKDRNEKTRFFFPAIGGDDGSEEEREEIKAMGIGDIFNYVKETVTPHMNMKYTTTAFYTNSVLVLGIIDKYNQLQKEHYEATKSDTDIKMEEIDGYFSE